MIKNIAILGAGSFGTAIALHLSRTGYQVMLWGHEESKVEAMQSHRENTQYLPRFKFPDNLQANADIHACIEHTDHVMIAVPSLAFYQASVALM